MTYYYSKENPKWNKADNVQAVTPDGSRVNVTIWQGTKDEQTFYDCLVENHNKFGATDRSDVLVADRNPSFGWRYVWFMNTDINPYQLSQSDSIAKG